MYFFHVQNIQKYVGIHVPPNLPRNYFSITCDDMKDSYIDMQHRYVNEKPNYVDVQEKCDLIYIRKIFFKNNKYYQCVTCNTRHLI